MPTFRLGINYWPTRTAMAMWSHFDPETLDTDFARIAAAGLETVRFFLLWEAFQPEADRIDRGALGKMERMLEALRKHRLRAMPTLFCGHMSGVNWVPRWTLDPTFPSARFRTIAGGETVRNGIGDFYAPGPLLEAQLFAVREIGAHFRGDETIEGWDLGNEFSNLRTPRTLADAKGWSEALAGDLFAASDRPVTAGIHGEDLEQDRNIRPSAICAPLQFATMHGYPVYATFARDRLDPEVVPFYYELVGAFSGKRVLFSEFGNPECPSGPNLSGHACLNEAEMASYAGEVLERLHRRGALGAYWWCYTDYDPRLSSVPPFDAAPHELHFGAWRADGTPKPVATALTRFAAQRREVVEPARTEPPLLEETWYTQPMHVKERFADYAARAAQR